MAGGPIRPSSIFHTDTTGRTTTGYYAGGGGNISPNEEGINVKAALDADAVVQLRFPIPSAIPSGTLKLRILALANSATNAAKVLVSDATVAAGASPSAASLTNENSNTPYTITWAAGGADKYNESKNALSASPAANDMLVVALTFKTSGWTLAVVGTFIVTILWE